MDGWVKIYRRIQGSSVWSDPVTLKVWMHLLLNATHKPRKVMHGSQEVSLQPGDLVIAYRETAARLGLSKDAFFRRVTALDRARMVRRKAGRYFTVISITNWSTYQSEEVESETPSETPSETEVRRTRDKNNNERMKEKRKEGTSPLYSPPFIEDKVMVRIEEHRVPGLIKYVGGQKIFESLIEELNDHMLTFPAKGQKYKDHAAVVRRWYRRARDEGKLPKDSGPRYQDLNH